MDKTQQALSMAITAQQQYEELAASEQDPVTALHYLDVARLFKLAAYDIAQLRYDAVRLASHA